MPGPASKRKCWECGAKRWLKRVKLYTEEGDHLCYRWYDVCKRCRDNMAEEWEDWPRGDDGRFLPSQECETEPVGGEPMTRADGIRLELPFPPPQLSPNSRPNRWEKAKFVREYREAVGWYAYSEYRKGGKPVVLPPLTPPVRAAVTFVVPDRHKRDMDNLLAMLKPAWDGLVDAGVLAGDDSERFSVESATIVSRYDGFLRRNVREPKVIVELRSL